MSPEFHEERSPALEQQSSARDIMNWGQGTEDLDDDQDQLDQFSFSFRITDEASPGPDVLINSGPSLSGSSH